MPTPTVFNLAWYSKPLGDKANPAPVTREALSTLGVRKQVGAIILFPSLTTPAILWGEEKLELLILAQDQTQLLTCLRHQLKISAGFDATKQAAARDLFVGPDNQLVGTAADWDFEWELIAFSEGVKVSTKSGRFAGFVDPRVYKNYTDAGYKHLYRITLSNKCLDAAAGGDRVSCFPQPQDELLNKVLDGYHPELRQGKHYYAFGEKDGDIDFLSFDKENPIQSWHPVFWYREGLEYATFGHVADIHMAARQNILARTTARVIDYSAFGTEGETDKSPELGPVVNICSKDLIDIFNQFTDTDMLLIGGDLVDCLRSAYPTEKQDLSRPKTIWDAVGLGDNYRDNYKDCVDLIGFYGIIVRYCGAHSKPAFLVSGNHDCYLEPYGLSPRIGMVEGPIGKRANEGIPADHNLTFYEAILSFGETFHELKSGLESPFDSTTFDWFYMVFTPFTDFSIEMPKQMLVAAGWGDGENVIDPEEIFVGQGFGHLPRAPEAVTEGQLELIDQAIAKEKSMTLMTHFTFVSYLESIPLKLGNKELGDVYCDTFRNYTDRNMGTFELLRAELLQDRVGKRKMEIVLTGHSHRRALYLVDRVDYSGRNSLKIRHFDFIDFATAQANHADIIKPAIIVSDSGGTIPRYNYGGEFSAWGSDIPSGTAVTFNGSGGVGGIETVRTQYCRPRAAVALDYMDIYSGDEVVESFESLEFEIAREGTLDELVFALRLNEELTKRGIFVREVHLFLKRTGMQWIKIPMQPGAISVDPNVSYFNISGKADVGAFITQMATHKDRGAFLAMGFRADEMLSLDEVWPFARYNFDDYWCWEFQVDYETSGRTVFNWAPKYKKYMIERDTARGEFPDFDWRRKAVPGKYA